MLVRANAGGGTSWVWLWQGGRIGSRTGGRRDWLSSRGHYGCAHPHSADVKCRVMVCCAMLCHFFAGADLKTIAATLKPAKELKWLVLRTAGVVGELSCDIILPSLSLLSLTRNGIMVRWMLFLCHKSVCACLCGSCRCAHPVLNPSCLSPADASFFAFPSLASRSSPNHHTGPDSRVLHAVNHPEAPVPLRQQPDRTTARVLSRQRTAALLCAQPGMCSAVSLGL